MFIGGGTPSLLSPQAYQHLFGQLKQKMDFEMGCEITLEANPATVEHGSFEGYLAAGINRCNAAINGINRIGDHHNLNIRILSPLLDQRISQLLH